MLEREGVEATAPYRRGNYDGALQTEPCEESGSFPPAAEAERLLSNMRD